MKRKLLLILFSFAIFISGCSVYKTLVNLSYIKFKIGNVSNFSVLGIDISGKSGLKDLDFVQVAKLTSATALNKLPVSFTINIVAKNTSKNAYETTDIQITDFPFTLILNDKEILDGDIRNPIVIPGKKKETVFPVEIKFDILHVFDDLSLDDIAQLVFELGGKNQNLSTLKIKAEPKLLLPGGLEYQQKVTITSDAFH